MRIIAVAFLLVGFVSSYSFAFFCAGEISTALFDADTGLVADSTGAPEEKGRDDEGISDFDPEPGIPEPGIIKESLGTGHSADTGNEAEGISLSGVRNHVTNYQIVKYKEKYTDRIVENKFYLFEGGAGFLLKKVVPDANIERDIETAMSVFNIRGKNGTVIYKDRQTGEWKRIVPDEGLFDTVLFFQTDETFSVVGPAVFYMQYGDGSLKDLGEWGKLSFKETESGYEVVLHISGSRASELHLWMCSVQEPDHEWDDEAAKMWERLDFDGKNRVCFDGAYYSTPESYVPYEAGMYYRCPAVHPALVLLGADSRIADIMSIGLLDEAVNHQNKQGYWPTPAESEWLSKEYGINSNFYDTRFNNDVTMRLFEAYKKFGYLHYLDAALRQTEWLMRHAASNHIKAEKGILVEDYGVAAGDRKVRQTHSSLNHQLQEIKVLLTAYECTADLRYYEFAQDLLDGIRSTETKWYNGNRGLAYGIKPDGTPDFNDYPYLTYNDLYDVQEILGRIGEGRDPVLDRLMAHKLRYMLENGITGYKANDENEMPAILKAVLDDFNKGNRQSG